MLQLEGQLGRLYGLEAAVFSTEREWHQVTHATIQYMGRLAVATIKSTEVLEVDTI